MKNTNGNRTSTRGGSFIAITVTLLALTINTYGQTSSSANERVAPAGTTQSASVASQPSDGKTIKPPVTEPARPLTENPSAEAVRVSPASQGENQDSDPSLPSAVATLKVTNAPEGDDESTNTATSTATAPPVVACTRTLKADVVAFDQPYLFNRLGAARPGGMIYALRGDVQPISGSTLSQGNVQLRLYKRARPIVLRANVGDCLEIKFENFLSTPPGANISPDFGPATLSAGIHLNGMQMIGSITSDGSNVGGNTNSLVAPGQSTTYKLFAAAEGTFLLYSMGAPMRTGQITAGMFGAVNVQPKTAEWYRSQVTQADMKLASNGSMPDGQPKMDYDKTYPPCPANDPRGFNQATRCSDPALPPLPVLNMLDSGNNIRHTDLTAMITGPKSNGYMFVDSGQPVFRKNPAEPNRNEPYREFTIIYHESTAAVQAFSQFYDKKLKDTLLESRDMFAINYGIGGIGAEILANRLNVGPMANCADCKFEEFFLSSWAVGDPAMIVDVPANTPCPGTLQNGKCLDPLPSPDPRVVSQTTTQLMPQEYNDPPGPPVIPYAQPKATKAFYPDDPSNVYHSYMGDHTKFRILHGGTGITHVHHLHAHQWIHTPNSDNSTYMDSQMLNPGAAYTLEIDYNGSGNRNKTVGDSIFHCHFYPHFAAGMWALWRSHDVFEAGTELGGVGRPLPGSRALPDGEIAKGTPIPAIVPIPTNAMAPMPGNVKIVPVCDIGVADANCSETNAIAYRSVATDNKNPGYPFFIPGVGGGRAPHPPLDFATDGANVLDGGLPRHLVVASQRNASGEIELEQHTQWDFTKELKRLAAFRLPEDGTPTEKVAMAYHAVCEHPSFTQLGAPKPYITNGLPQQPGAPFADPATNGYDASKPLAQRCESVIATGQSTIRRYKAAVIQMDTVFNKVGWHFPQQRMLTLWGDVAPTIKGDRPPEPFFFRANSGDVVEYWHTNLVPNYYELDDFQVRTPTDILGQHIHLVKFDVTSSDGSGNGFNYEDGTFSPDEVRDLIEWINNKNQITNGQGLFEFDPATQWANKNVQTLLHPKPPPADITAGLLDPGHYNDCSQPNDPTKGIWCGAQTTIQRWYADPLLNLASKDRTIRTVFTHDHFGPSTHQQVGLYSALVVEPKGSQWRETEPSPGFPAGRLMGSRADGGPTSWRANIEMATAADSYREFLFEIQDMTLAYGPKSKNQSQFVPYPCLGKTSQQCAPIIAAIEQQVATAVQNGTTPAPWGWADYPNSINPVLPSNTPPTLFPISSISGNIMGSQSLNYRNEPLPNRLITTKQITPDNHLNEPANGAPGNLSHVFRSIDRPETPEVSKQPTGNLNGCNPVGKPWDPNWPCFMYPKPLSSGVNGPDPFTPLLRVYEGDKVQVRVLPGAHMTPHYFTFNGVNWLFEPGTPTDPTATNNSGFRATQPMGISEHWEMLFKVPAATKAAAPSSCTGPDGKALVNCTSTDYLYTGNALATGLQHGMWGLMRAYSAKQADLLTLPNNNPPASNSPLSTGCPSFATKKRTYDVTAITTGLVYNSRKTGPPATATTLTNDNAIIYVMTEDLKNGNLNKMRIEPLVLRAAAGDCIEVKLTNAVDPNSDAFKPTAMGVPFGEKLNPTYPKTLQEAQNPPFTGWELTTSRTVGLHPQLLSYNATASDGMNVGANPVQTIPPASSPPTSLTYHWYAGNAANASTSTAVEFGAIGLFPSDPLLQHPAGLVGALVIEPKGSSWICDGGVNCDGTPNNGKVPISYASAIVKKSDGTTFREFVVVTQDDAIIKPGGAAAINYRSEPMTFRYTNPPGTASQTACPNLGSPGTDLNSCPDVQRSFGNKLVQADPQTPIFTANAGQPVRFRLVQPGGATNGQVFTLHGHVWQEQPYKNNSTEIGDNPLSESIGSRDSYGAASHYDVVINKAGGEDSVPGDYLYRTFIGAQIPKGIWGIFRVAGACGAQCPDTVTITSYTMNGSSFKVQGSNTVRPSTGLFAGNVNICGGEVNTCTQSSGTFLHRQPVDPLNGTWEFNGTGNPQGPEKITAISDFGGKYTFIFQAEPGTQSPVKVAPEKKDTSTDRFQTKSPTDPKKP